MTGMQETPEMRRVRLTAALCKTPPRWAGDAFSLVARLNTAGLRIRALRLTDEQWEDLRDYFGAEPKTLLGYPVRRVEEAA